MEEEKEKEKPKRKYIRKPKKVTIDESENIVKDIEELPTKLEKIPLERSSGPRATEETKEEEEQQEVLKMFESAFRKPMFRTDVCFYTENDSPDMCEYMKVLQEKLLELRIGTQFVVYDDPKTPKFVNLANVANLFVCDERCEPFWRMTLGRKGSKAVYLKEIPRQPLFELAEVIKTSTEDFENSFIKFKIVNSMTE
jgi:hypothetical protein